MPSLTPVDVLTSHARRRGDQVTVVLDLPHDAPLDPALAPRSWVRFVVDVDSVDVPAPVDAAEAGFRVAADVTATGSGWRVVAHAPTERLVPGLWKIRVQPEGQQRLFLQVRLLTSDTQPVALLPGPRPDTAMAPPTT